MSSVIERILEAFNSYGPLSPGDVAQKLDIPRYKVLATIQCLNEFGLLEALYSRGSYKIYQTTIIGKKVLEKIKEKEPLKDLFESIILGDINNDSNLKTPA